MRGNFQEILRKFYTNFRKDCEQSLQIVWENILGKLSNFEKLLWFFKEI